VTYYFNFIARQDIFAKVPETQEESILAPGGDNALSSSTPTLGRATESEQK